MAEIETSQNHETISQEPQKNPINISFSIWPPTQRTRDAVIHRLIDTLTTPSVLSKRYGSVPNDEASDVAKNIEDEAFAVAGASVAGDGDDGIETLQVYSKDISKRMLDAVKSRSSPEADNKPSPSPAPEDASELSVETET